ncbi:MAG: TIGR02281 family clan AA aspartic protease [Pseudomonadota bacterium]|nr:TIGR02281 family clan AA aspartic protease [Pseudomonadota bacterium]
MTDLRYLLAAAALSACAGVASAQTVSLGGSLGSRALLVINGKAKNVALGSTVDGVKLLSVSGNDAVVEVQGKRVALQLGGAPVNLGGAASGGTGQQIKLTAQSGGHFLTSGTINGRTVNFVVDTGATNVVLSAAEADRIGLEYKNGSLTYSSTANGMIVAYRVRLASIRIGDVQVYDVDATVVPASMPFVLLGNSYLQRFQMRRENDLLTLDKRN